MRVRSSGVRLAAAVVLLAGLAGCDDQVKYVPWFSTMYRQSSVETYEEPGRLPPEGAVPLGSSRRVPLDQADALSNPLTGQALDPAAAGRGQTLYLQYCIVCHGPTGAGDGPVVGPNRLPALPTLNLRSDRARGLTDGYIWGMIANGRGVMPSYGRIPSDDRWYVVNYVRQLQGGGAPAAAVGAATGATSTTGATTPDTAAADAAGE
jgi:mono/diheme cytochrome c family protein